MGVEVPVKFKLFDIPKNSLDGLISSILPSRDSAEIRHETRVIGIISLVIG